MSRRTRNTIVVLILFAAYCVFVIVRAITAKGHGSSFWTQIGVIVVLAVAALLLSRWIHRRNRARPNALRRRSAAVLAGGAGAPGRGGLGSPGPARGRVRRPVVPAVVPPCLRRRRAREGLSKSRGRRAPRRPAGGARAARCDGPQRLPQPRGGRRLAPSAE